MNKSEQQARNCANRGNNGPRELMSARPKQRILQRIHFAPLCCATIAALTRRRDAAHMRHDGIDTLTSGPQEA